MRRRVYRKASTAQNRKSRNAQAYSRALIRARLGTLTRAPSGVLASIFLWFSSLEHKPQRNPDHKVQFQAGIGKVLPGRRPTVKLGNPVPPTLRGELDALPRTASGVDAMMAALQYTGAKPAHPSRCGDRTQAREGSCTPHSRCRENGGALEARAIFDPRPSVTTQRISTTQNLKTITTPIFLEAPLPASWTIRILGDKARRARC